ncbi:MAG: tetratricopeptide repeat protein [Endomicrobiales bacterium]|jgi:TolA-binding protein
MATMTRHDLKKNELEDFLIFAIKWVQNNRQTFFTIVAIVAGIILFSLFFFVRLHTAKLRANDKLSMAQAQIYGGQVDAGLGSLDELITQYSGTAASTQARMLKADYYASKKDFVNAEKTIRPVIDAGIPPSIIPLAYSILGDIEENAGNYKGAIATYTEYLEKYPDHFLVPKVYESLGRLYELSGSPAEAKGSYEKLTTLYPGTGWAQRAQERIAMVSAIQAKTVSK